MTSLRSFLLLPILLLGGLLTVPSVQAQQQMADTRALFSPTVKEYGRPGYPRMTLYVWGNADSGVWNVEQGTDLLEFLSVVSRARMTDNSPERRRVEIVSIYRNQRPDQGDDPFFRSRVHDMFSNPGSYPALQEGDILVLETKMRGRFTWRDIARVTGTVAALLNTYLLFDRLSNN